MIVGAEEAPKVPLNGGRLLMASSLPHEVNQAQLLSLDSQF